MELGGQPHRWRASHAGFGKQPPSSKVQSQQGPFSAPTDVAVSIAAFGPVRARGSSSAVGLFRHNLKDYRLAPATALGGAFPAQPS